MPYSIDSVNLGWQPIADTTAAATATNPTRQHPLGTNAMTNMRTNECRCDAICSCSDVSLER